MLSAVTASVESDCAAIAGSLQESTPNSNVRKCEPAQGRQQLTLKFVHVFHIHSVLSIQG
jgi:hypothetical protein